MDHPVEFKALLPQGRLADKEAAEAEAARLRAEVGQLAQRLVELKATEAERMDEVNVMCEQMVRCLLKAPRRKNSSFRRNVPWSTRHMR